MQNNSITSVPPLVTPIERGSHHDMLNVFLKREQLQYYKSKPLVNNKDNPHDFDQELCHLKFCCKFEFNITYLPTPLTKVGKQPSHLPLFVLIKFKATNCLLSLTMWSVVYCIRFIVLL